MPGSAAATSTNGHNHHPGVIRRTASFTNIDRIVEVSNEQEDEEDADQPLQKGGRKAVIEKFNQKKSRFAATLTDSSNNHLNSQQTSVATAVNYKHYLESPLSPRNTYLDEEFFRVFTQYLDEAIVKLKQQVDLNESENNDGDDEEEEEEEEDGSSNN